MRMPNSCATVRLPCTCQGRLEATAVGSRSLGPCALGGRANGSLTCAIRVDGTL
jgi:hypothetical protein